MTLLTLCQAAKAANKAKSTLLEAIRSGRLSAFKNGKNHWQIDQDELFRVYPLTGQKPGVKTEHDQSRPNNETASLRKQVEYLEQQVNDIKDERDDLRRRLNDETEERRNLTAFIIKNLDDNVLSLFRLLDMTPFQYNNFTILFKGINLITENYYQSSSNNNKMMFFYTASNPKIRDELIAIGVLIDGCQVSAQFKQVTTSILQGRGINKITIYDLVNIAKRYTEEWVGLKKLQST